MTVAQYLQLRRDAAVLKPAAPPAAGTARAAGRLRRLDWTLIAPPAVTLTVMLWGISAGSYWRDESATLSAVTRSLPGLLRMLGRVDAVHGFYYLLLWPVVHLAGTREVVTRMPSALAMAAAAFGVAAIGRRIASRRAGLYAGLVFAGLPLVSAQGHDARPYALETAAVVAASYLMLQAADEPRPGRLAAYAFSLVAVGYMQMFGLLVLAAHAIAWIPAARLAHARRAEAVPGGGPADGASSPPGDFDLARRWLITVAAVAVAMVPLVWLGWRQRQQIAWLPRPDPRAIYAMITYLAGYTLASVIVMAVLIAIGAAQARPRDRLLTQLAAPWLVLPPAILLVAGQLIPAYQLMYVVFCLPAVALLAGAGIAALGWPLRPVALALVVVLALPAQLANRGPFAGGDLRGAARILASHKLPGDAVFYAGNGVPTWDIAYPAGFGGLRDIGLGESAVAAGALAGVTAPQGVIHRRLREVRRLWVIEMSPVWRPPGIVLAPAFRLAAGYRVGVMWMRLYVRAGNPPPSSR